MCGLSCLACFWKDARGQRPVITFSIHGQGSTGLGGYKSVLKKHARSRRENKSMCPMYNNDWRRWKHEHSTLVWRAQNGAFILWVLSVHIPYININNVTLYMSFFLFIHFLWHSMRRDLPIFIFLKRAYIREQVKHVSCSEQQQQQQRFITCGHFANHINHVRRWMPAVSTTKAYQQPGEFAVSTETNIYYTIYSTVHQR